MLWFYEASAVLSRAQNNGTRAGTKAAQFIVELQSLNITADPDSAAAAHLPMRPVCRNGSARS